MSLVSESPPSRFSSFHPDAQKLLLHRVLPQATHRLLARGEDTPALPRRVLSRRQTMLQERRKPVRSAGASRTHAAQSQQAAGPEHQESGTRKCGLTHSHGHARAERIAARSVTRNSNYRS